MFLQQHSDRFLTSILRGNEINEIFYGKHLSWVEVFSELFENSLEIKKNQPLGFLVIESENLKFRNAPSKKKKMRQTKRIYRRIDQKRKRQSGGFLNRYDVAYAGRDVVNQAAKVAPGVIKAATNDINNSAKDTINQTISEG